MKYSIKLVLLLLFISLHASRTYAQELSISKYSKELLVPIQKGSTIFMLTSRGDLLYVMVKGESDLDFKYNIDGRTQYTKSYSDKWLRACCVARCECSIAVL